MTPERKRLYTIIILTVLCLIVVTELGNFRSKQLAINLADNQIKLALNRVAENLDKEGLKEIISSLDDNNHRYSEVRELLIRVKEEHGLADIYLLSKDEQENSWFYIANARPDGDSQRVSLGDVDIRLFGPLEGVLRGKVIEKEYYRTTEGFNITSYQGIKDNEGNLMTVVGGDYTAGEMSNFLYLTRYVQAGIIFVSFLLIWVTVLLSRR